MMVDRASRRRLSDVVLDSRTREPQIPTRMESFLATTEEELLLLLLLLLVLLGGIGIDNGTAPDVIIVVARYRFFVRMSMGCVSRFCVHLL